MPANVYIPPLPILRVASKLNLLDEAANIDTPPHPHTTAPTRTFAKCARLNLRLAARLQKHADCLNCFIYFHVVSHGWVPCCKRVLPTFSERTRDVLGVFRRANQARALMPTIEQFFSRRLFPSVILQATSFWPLRRATGGWGAGCGGPAVNASHPKRVGYARWLGHTGRKTFHISYLYMFSLFFFLCMHLCFYVSMHLCIYVSLYLCTYAFLHPCFSAPMYLCTYVAMRLCT